MRVILCRKERQSGLQLHEKKDLADSMPGGGGGGGGGGAGGGGGGERL